MHHSYLLFIDKLGALLSFLLLLSYFMTIELVLVYVVIRLLTILTSNKAILIIISGLINLISIGIIIVGIGVLVSLDIVSTWLTILLGFVFGLFIVPSIFQVENN